MKIRIRGSNKDDLDGIYELQNKCFASGDQWYKSFIIQYLNNSLVVEKIESKEIIGVLLQGPTIACDLNENDKFIPMNKSGEIFKEQKLHFEPTPGITMLCIHPDFRNKGLASELIKLHFKKYNNELVCLQTRKSNPAYNLYTKHGYEHIASIKEKYYSPTEDSCFMIHSNQ
jgi:ribosomal protein S18 acetylase RimI-like enzyme